MSYSALVTLIFIIGITGCKTPENPWTNAVDSTNNNNPVTAAGVAEKYCKACHGLGEVKFMMTANADANWENFFVLQSPYGVPWATVMLEALTWPVDNPDLLSKPQYFYDWMPIGSKRFEIITQKIGKQDARQFLANSLESELRARGLPLSVDPTIRLKIKSAKGSLQNQQ